MFTLQSIYAAFDKVSNSRDYASFFKELKRLGVSYYDSFVEDGHTEYFDKKGNSISGEPKYKHLEIGHENAMNFTNVIEQQRKGEIDFETFCREAAKNGIHKWKTDIENMRVTYLNTKEETVFQEPIAVE